MRDVVNVVVVKKGRLPHSAADGFQATARGQPQADLFRYSPPRSFVTAAMDLTVVRATERHRELVTDPCDRAQSEKELDYREDCQHRTAF